MTREQLIAALEAATGPSRELDVAIVYALYPDIGPYAAHCAGDPPIFWFDPYYKQECPLFTASIDAALSLVPEGWRVYALQQFTVDTAKWACGLDMRYGPGQVLVREAPSPAIALCIAALKARP